MLNIPFSSGTVFRFSLSTFILRQLPQRPYQFKSIECVRPYFVRTQIPNKEGVEKAYLSPLKRIISAVIKEPQAVCV